MGKNKGLHGRRVSIRGPLSNGDTVALRSLRGTQIVTRSTAQESLDESDETDNEQDYPAYDDFNDLRQDDEDREDEEVQEQRQPEAPQQQQHQHQPQPQHQQQATNIEQLAAHQLQQQAATPNHVVNPAPVVGGRALENPEDTTGAQQQPAVHQPQQQTAIQLATNQLQQQAATPNHIVNPAPVGSGRGYPDFFSPRNRRSAAQGALPRNGAVNGRNREEERQPLFSEDEYYAGDNLRPARNEHGGHNGESKIPNFAIFGAIGLASIVVPFLFKGISKFWSEYGDAVQKIDMDINELVKNIEEHVFHRESKWTEEVVVDIKTTIESKYFRGLSVSKKKEVIISAFQKNNLCKEDFQESQDYFPENKWMQELQEVKCIGEDVGS